MEADGDRKDRAVYNKLFCVKKNDSVHIHQLNLNALGTAETMKQKNHFATNSFTRGLVALLTHFTFRALRQGVSLGFGNI
jgi:hypothetical protein